MSIGANKPAAFAQLRERCMRGPCGTRAKYRGGCRCMLCRAANSRYETARGKESRIRARTERKILAADESIRADRSLVPARPSWQLIDKLLGEGYSRTQLARWLGSKAKTPALQLRGRRITARTALNVERMVRAVEDGRLWRTR
jgi:hypothetical protein